MANAVAYDILTQVQTLIQGRGLVDEFGVAIPSKAVVLQGVPSNQPNDLPPVPDVYPCILIALFGTEGLNPNEGATSRDDVHYPVIVCILDKLDEAGRLPLPRLNVCLTWRESIRKQFHNQNAPAINTTGGVTHQTQVTPLAMIDPETWRKRGLFASGMLLKVASREPRG